jgi:hypothetical protein
MCMRRVDMDRLQELVRLHRLGSGGREVARLLRMGPNTERDYRRALAAEQLLEGPVDELPELDVLKAAVERQLAKGLPAQMVSSVAEWEAKIIQLAEAGLTAQPIFDRLKPSTLARNDPGLLARNDPVLIAALARPRSGDGRRRCAEEAPVFDLSPMVHAGSASWRSAASVQRRRVPASAAPRGRPRMARPAS